MKLDFYNDVNLNHNLLLKYFLILILLFVFVMPIYSQRNKKTKKIGIYYHNLTSKYNAFFNAGEILKEQQLKFNNSKEDYTKIIPIYRFPQDDDTAKIAPECNKILEKCNKVINKHSREEKGKELIKWIDDNYLLIGIAYFYKRDFKNASTVFKFISRKFKENKTHFDALIWIIKIYIEEKNFVGAERVIRLLKNDPLFPARLNEELEKIQTHLYLTKQDYSKAIESLKKTIYLEKKKKKKARLIFILAQIYKEINDIQNATRNYEMVIKLNPKYDMVFYSKIEIATLSSLQSGDYKKEKRELMNLLKDEKNKEFKDLIYYALGELERKQKNIILAIEDYKLSASFANKKSSKKGLSYYRISEIYYELEKYEQAKIYFDSTVIYLNKEHPKYVYCKIMNDNLSELIEQLKIIHLEDSLQMIVKLPEKERLIFIQDLIFQEELEKQKKLEKQQLKQNNNVGQKKINFTGAPPKSNKSGTFYFDNPSIVEKGKKEFIAVWGNRKNEDNWRISQKLIGFNVDKQSNFDNNNNKEEDIQEKTDEIYNTLPISKQALDSSNQRIIKAYYIIGNIYQERIKNNKKAIDAFEKLNKKEEIAQYLPEIYYRLYRLYLIEKDEKKTSYYKTLILSRYLNSNYAKILLDPSGVQDDKSREDVAEAFYKDIYENYFSRGFYSQTLNSINQEQGKYKQTSIEPKFDLIKAMAIGYSSGKQVMLNELNKIKTKYNGKPEAEKASELIVLLTNQSKKQIKEETKVINDKYITSADDKFKFYIILKVEKKFHKSMEIALNNFNSSKFSLMKLKYKIKFNETQDTATVIVDEFSNLKEAMTYFEGFKNEKFKLYIFKKNNPIYFFISNKNQKILEIKKDIEKYKQFFIEKYL